MRPAARIPAMSARPPTMAPGASGPRRTHFTDFARSRHPRDGGSGQGYHSQRVLRGASGASATNDGSRGGYERRLVAACAVSGGLSMELHCRRSVGSIGPGHYVGRSPVDRRVLRMATPIIPPAKLPAIADAAAVNRACDALDGVKDGVLNDPRRCHFDPASPLCSGSG